MTDELAVRQPELIGRGKELGILRQALDGIVEGQGSTILISGEAGIGKTRLVSEFITMAETAGSRVLRGWCLAESLEPLMPLKTSLRDAGLFHLISGDPPPTVVSAYLMNEAGIVLARAEREVVGLDSDIFAGMLQAVGNFVRDSLVQMDKKVGAGLDTLGFGDHTILIRTSGRMSLAIVIKGTGSEFLIDDMRRTLDRIGDKYDDWSGDTTDVAEVQPQVSWFIGSGKYDGKFLVDDPKLRQENLFDNILLGLQRASTEMPLVLFVDDLQWSDPTTLNLIHYLARNTRSNRILILGTYRPEDIAESAEGAHRLETAMQNMNREDLFSRIELKRLDLAETEEVIRSALGETDFEGRFYEKVFGETEGTPFYILEVVRLLAEEGGITREDGAWRPVAGTELDLPSKVYDVVKRRLDRLEPVQKEILECASVIGKEFSSEVVGRTLGLDKLALLKALRTIENTHRLIHYLGDTYMFDHTKIRDVLYSSLGDELRREYHRIIADAIAELHRPEEAVNELAYHYLMADDVRAGRYLVRAGENAQDRYANEEAVSFYTNALPILRSEADLAHVHENLGDIYSLTGEYEKAAASYTRLIERGKGPMLAEVHRKLAEVLERTGDYPGSRGECDKGLDLLEEECIESAGLLAVRGWTFSRSGEHDRAREILLESLRIAEEFDDRKMIAQIHHNLGTVFMFTGEYETALEHLDTARQIRAEINDVIGLPHSYNNLGNLFWNLGELDRALGYYAQSLEILQKIGDKQGIAKSYNNTGGVYHGKGEMEKSLDYFDRSLGILRKIGDRNGTAGALINQGVVYQSRGELDKALANFRESLEILEKVGNKIYIAVSLNNIAEILQNKGELDEALEYYERSIGIRTEVGDKRGLIFNHCGLAWVHAELGDHKTAEGHARTALDLAIEIGAKSEEGISRRMLAIVFRESGHPAESAEQFERAKAILEDLGGRKETAIAYYEYALLFKKTSEPDKAKALLELALPEFERMGMRLWEERAREALNGS